MSAAFQGGRGQNHDRFKPSEDAFAGATMLSSQDDGGADAVVEINATQKMISAISGSLVTSLLGEHKPPLDP
jgi:solute carrier family 25, member 39/40